MASCGLVLFLSAIFIFVAPAVAQPNFQYHLCSNDKGNYSVNSTYKANLNILLASLYANTEINYGFYSSSYGQNSDQVYAIGLCRGDVQTNVCRSCLQSATSLLKQHCPNQKEAFGWYNNCTLRYSYRSIFGVEELWPRFYMWNGHNITAAYVTQFNEDLRTLLESLMSQAAAGDSLRKFAANNATGPGSQKIHALVQCTPDLSQPECSDCLHPVNPNADLCGQNPTPAPALPTVPYQDGTNWYQSQVDLYESRSVCGALSPIEILVEMRDILRKANIAETTRMMAKLAKGIESVSQDVSHLRTDVSLLRTDLSEFRQALQEEEKAREDKLSCRRMECYKSKLGLM